MSEPTTTATGAMIADYLGTGFHGWLLANQWAANGLSVVVLGLLGYLGYLFTRRVLLPAIGQVVKKTRFTWDDILVDAEVFRWLSWVVVTVAIYYGSIVLEGANLLTPWIAVPSRNLANAGTALAVVFALGSLLNAVNQLYVTKRPDLARSRPIKGYIQLVKIFLYVVGTIVVIASARDVDPWKFVAGIGALTAVLLLIFKDTILSLVASVQIASNDMVRVGDWIEMPHLRLDGDVIDVSLHTIKVQNFDKTISTIPTHRLITDSFKNWRGMKESGGRRIKRDLHIDLGTIRFLTAEEIDGFGRWALLVDYIRTKREDLASWQEAHADRDPGVVANSRRLTNVGTFRAYIEAYLKSLPDIHLNGMTFLVRQLQAGEHGLPIQLYCFTATTVWGDYEAIQADIFDHLLAIAGEFGLRIYQAPSGADLQCLRPA